MGSKSDWDAMRQADEILTRFDVPHESPGHVGAPDARADDGVRVAGG